jgi:hypothetical protein
MEEIMEFLRAIEHKREAESKANQEKMDAIERKMMDKMDAIQATTDFQLEETMARLGETKASSVTTEDCEEKTEACLENSQEVPEGATDEEAIGGAKGRSRDLRRAVRCRGRLKTRTKCDGRLRQDCAATVGRPTRRSFPAMRKGGLRRGPGKKCRRGSKGQNKAFRIGKRKMIGKQRRRLERRRTFYEAVEPTLGPEVINLVFESSVGLREPGNGTLWKCRPPPKRKR